MDDRRATPRLNVSLDARLEGATGKYPAQITNLSEGGCYLDTVGQVMPGEIVAFRVQLPDDDFLYLEGEVRHYNVGVGFGVRFVELNDEQMESLKALIRRAVESGASETPISADLVEE